MDPMMAQGGMAPPPEAGLPPELASLLGGAMAPPEEEMPMESEAPTDSEGYARELLSMIQEWRTVEQDEEDLLMLEQVSTLLQKLLARNQKEAQDAMTGKLSPRMLAQSYGGG